MRCTACNGLKKVMKLGMRPGDCDACKGTGLEPIKTEIIEPIQPLTENKDAAHEKKETNSKTTRKK